MSTQLGNYLRELREARGLSTRQLARQAGCSQSLVTRLEAGDRLPSLVRLRDIVRVLEGDLGEALFLLCVDAGIPAEEADQVIIRRTDSSKL